MAGRDTDAPFLSALASPSGGVNSDAISRRPRREVPLSFCRNGSRGAGITSRRTSALLESLVQKSTGASDVNVLGKVEKREQKDEARSSEVAEEA